MIKTRGEFNIIFMGTPAFAVPSLDILLRSGYSIRAVVTSPDKPAGRGLIMRMSEVRQYAESQSLHVMQPESLKDWNFARSLELLLPDLIVVVAFRMLPEVVWKIPAYGTINLHASLLPQYRGAAPINHAIINGERVSGVTTFLINRQIDTGSILLQEAVEIGTDETAGQLHNRLMHTGAELMLKTIDQLREGSVRPVEQANFYVAGNMLHTAPKITKDFCSIKWQDHAMRIVNLIRGLSPYPCAHTTICSPEGLQFKLKVYSARFSEKQYDLPCGSIIVENQNELLAVTPKGCVAITELQPAGKSRMTAQDFVNGYRLKQGWKVQ